MTFIQRWTGKYVTIDPKNPSALGMCGNSGFIFNHKDMVKQMEWYGNSKVWTGKLVGKPFEDVPSEQNRPPQIKSDPYPIDNPRYPEIYTDPNSTPALSYAELTAKLNSFKWNG